MPTPRTRHPTPRAASTSASCSSSIRGWPRSRPPCCRCPRARIWCPAPSSSPRRCVSTGTWRWTPPRRSVVATVARTRSALHSASPSTSRPPRTSPSRSARGTPWRRSGWRWTRSSPTSPAGSSAPDRGTGCRDRTMSDLTDPGPGISLSRAYHQQVVGPLLDRHLPGLPYAAARLGSGSDVLGFDDEQSRDHDWGLRLTLLVEEGRATQVEELLESELPPRWAGLPTRFGTTWDPVPRQRVEVASAADFSSSRLGLPASRLTGTLELTVTDWLSLTGQAVLEVAAGPVFHDEPGVLTSIRQRLLWYPRDVWLYALAADWHRLGQEFPDVGRSGVRGDEDGSAVIAARHVRTMLHLVHLLHRRWPPYGKWLARSAAALPAGGALRAALGEVLRAPEWSARQAALAEAAELLGAAQREAGLPTLEPVTEAFFERPHIGVRDLPALLLEQIEDPAVRALPAGVGTAEQISDNVTVLVDAAARRRLVGG